MDPDIRFVWELQQLPGAKKFDGECSVQVLLPRGDGTYWRIGVTDDDVAERPGLWCDIYPPKVPFSIHDIGVG
jgi:hypothetical protein